MTTDLERDKNFIEQCSTEAAAALNFAITRNMARILDDIEKQTALFDAVDEAAKTIKACIVIAVTKESQYAAKINVEKVEWTRRFKTVDKDFPEQEVDLDQLKIDFAQPAAPSAEAPGKLTEELQKHGYQSFKNLLAAAREIHMDLFYPCRCRNLPNWKNTVMRYMSANSDWKSSLYPDGRWDDVAEAAHACGDLVCFYDQNAGCLKLDETSLSNLLLGDTYIGKLDDDKTKVQTYNDRKLADIQQFLNDGGVIADLILTPSDIKD